MALISPGVEVTVVDEANYAPNQLGTIPLILLATAESKTNPSGATATGTIKANAGKLVAATSQRELLNLFGSPGFYQTAAGTPLHGYELNEYGLMAAYSALGVTNRIYAIRADVDLAQLEGTSVRPLGTPPNNTYWLNLAYTNWGIFQWNLESGTFNKVNPIVISAASDTVTGVDPLIADNPYPRPLESIGSIGNYAVVTTDTSNPVYYKRYDNKWVLINEKYSGDVWIKSNPIITGSKTGSVVTSTTSLTINGVVVTLTVTSTPLTVDDVVTAITSANIAGVVARKTATGHLALHGDTTMKSGGVSAAVDGQLIVAAGAGATAVGLTAGTYKPPKFAMGPHTQRPAWKSTDTTPRPSGSVWIQTTSANSGASFDLSVYSSLTDLFNPITAPVYGNDQEANRALDPIGGGKNIAVGTIYVEYDSDRWLGNETTTDGKLPTFRFYRRAAIGPTVVTGVTVPSATAFTNGNTFTVRVSNTASNALSSAYTVTLTGQSPAAFVTSVQSANIPNLEAQVTSTGQIAITHTQGGVIALANGTGTPLDTAGFTTAVSNIRLNGTTRIASNWVPLTYTASSSRPSSDPADGTLWYYSDVSDVDIMVHDGSAWKGYKTISTDARGYDLSATDPEGVIVAAAEPFEQSDGTPLVSGDLWIDTGDLENYPMLYRYNANTSSWSLIDNTDQLSENGILFADARWDSNGTVDPIVDAVPTTKSLLTSNYVDKDSPDPALYPRGMLLFNTRRSGYNVKKFRKNYYNLDDFTPPLPTVKNAWVSVAGNKENGSPWMGRKAQRQVVVDAMRAAIDGNTEIREEQQVFNLILAPGYHELIPNMITLKNDRKDTAFILGDTPFRLAPDAISIANFNNNVNGEGLAVNDAYCALFYPCGISNDLTGNTIVVPPTHMALRTIIRSDNISFPWFAPAGTQRGLVDNASQLGYVDAASGEFVFTGLTLGIRDTLYENKINPVTFLPGVGIAVYGQKTRDPNAPSALDRINVARLAVYIRTNMNILAKPFVFEPNDSLTRNNLKAIIERMMNDLVAKRALQDYVVVCDQTNNTPLRIDRNELYVDVAIIPVKAAEFIYIPIRIRNTGSL